jgi:hypothetical protein
MSKGGCESSCSTSISIFCKAHENLVNAPHRASNAFAIPAWQRDNGTALLLIAVSMDDSDAPVRAMATTLKLTFPVAMGDAKLGSRYGAVLGLPLSLLFDRSGVIIARFQGEEDQDALDAQVRQLLAHH